jgi:plasmid stabilization system protein ParE
MSELRRGVKAGYDRLRPPPGAFDDIDEIAEYIGQSSLEAAHRVVDEIYQSIQNLVPFSHRGHRRPDLTSRPLRFIRLRDYLIAYAPEEKPLWVIAVMHGHRSPRVMAAILRGRED